MKTPPVAADAELELSAAALRALVAEAPDGIFVANVEGRCTYVNKAGCRLLGYKREEILSKTIKDLIPPEEITKLESVRQALLNGATDTFEWQLKRADGTYVAVEVTANIVANGQWHGFVRDVTARKLEQAQREALTARVQRDQRQLQALFDTLPIAVALFGSDGALTCNRRAEVLLGIELQSHLGARQYAAMVFSPEGRPVAEEQLLSARAMRGETVNGEEFQVRRADGVLYPVLGSAAPVRDESGMCVGAVCVYADLSERMQLERDVRRKERLLEAVFELLPVGVWIADASGTITTTNPAGERIWGGARYVPPSRFGEYRGWWVSNGKAIAPEEWALARALRNRETCTGELIRIACFDGSSKTIINSAAPILDERGDLVGAIVVNEDITALHEVEQKHAAGEQLFRTVFDLLPVGLWIGDREGRIVSANPAAQQIWQGARYVAAESFGEYRAWWVDTGEPLAAQDWGIARAIHRGQTSRRELIRIQCFDGSFKTVINWAAPIRSDSGEITGAIAVNEDVTGLHQTQEQLRAAVRDREQILAVVSHDLRNPLSAILTTAGTIEMKAAALPQGAPIGALAEMLTDVARQMSGMVNDLLSVAIDGTGRSVLELRPVNASALVERAARTARSLFARKGIAFRVEVEPDLPVLHVDPDRIERVFANLLDNARKFTASSGAVILRAQAHGPGVRFSVANSGPALSDEQIGGMFRPFWQAGRVDTRGAGLGLSICRSIVEAHGGTIWAEPAAGQRVRLCLLLPAAAPMAFAHSTP